jgi:tetratricopeptide (TPR) repeat protein
VKKEQWTFLIGGFAFGILFGYALFVAVAERPFAAQGGTLPASAAPMPAGPPAPTQTAGGAPMMQEINELKAHLQEHPRDTSALLRLAGLFSQVGMWDQADPLYARAIESQPEDTELVIRMAHLYHDSGRFEGAIGYYQKALELQPDDPNLITDMGTCFKQIGQFDEAITQFEKAQSIDPTHWQSLFNIAVVRGFDLGEVERAVEVVDRLEKMKPDAPGVSDLREALLSKLSETAGTAGS